MIVGIDLGTTHSAIGVWRGSRVELIPNGLGEVLTPSAVSIDDNGEILVGRAARERQVTHPDATATAFKRYIGTQRTARLSPRESFNAEELSALVLRSLKRDAEVYLGESVTEAVITVPAYFNDKQRKATRRAGVLAGFTVERLLNEPTAAALAYGIHQREQDSRYLVFDLGGGTFDVSILEIFEGIIEVRASTGDNRLGGEDFNQLLIDDFLPLVRERWSAHRRLVDPVLLERVREQAERARRTLTNNSSATMTVSFEDQVFSKEISAEYFEQLCEPLLVRLREPVLRAMRDGNAAAEAINEFVLVGGATRMPVVRRAVTRMFGRFPGAGPDPDQAIVIGAAIQAGLKARDVALKDVVMTDVCPYTLGVDTGERRADASVQRGIFAPIIERNTVVPASRMQVFSTMQDNQRNVVFNIYQGESRNVNDNVHLGKISLIVPARPAGAVTVEVRFTYDINGLLEVDTKVPETGETLQLTLADDDLKVDAEAFAKRRAELAALKLHPREQSANRATLAHAARCYEEYIGERRMFIGDLMRRFEAVLDRQDPREIDSARREVDQLLDSIDSGRHL